MHPLLLILLLLIVIGLVQRAFRSEPKPTARAGIGVVLVAPPRVDVEPKLQRLLRLSSNPSLVRLYVAKMCGASDAPVELGDLKTRAASRMHFVRARRNTPERLRAALVREVLEPHLLCLPWHHEAVHGWDELLLREWTACSDAHAVLTARLSSRPGEAGFLFLTSFDGERAAFGSAPFASPPAGPERSIACSAQLLFAPTPLLQRGWPAKSDVVGVHEDATLTAFLWMHGARFYSPHNQPVLAEAGHEPPEDPGRVGLPATPTLRTREELWTALGIRNGKLSSRARAGLTVRASFNERFHKIGQTIALQREL